ncbi:MAG: hypothetical protein P8166_04910 [Candidatus Thiodiazotropha sp.]
MLRHSRNAQTLLAIFLALLMLGSRGHHDLTPIHLPDASWAIFFLLGLYLRSSALLAGFFLLAAVMDYVAITWGGVSSFCVTGAYLFLIPAYGSLWLAGRSYSGMRSASWRGMMPLALHALAGTLVCELISSGGFYFFSGRFAEPTLAEFSDRFLIYLPGNLQAVALYLGLAALMHWLFSLARGKWGRAGARAT